MIQKVRELVSVAIVCDGKQRSFVPQSLVWHGRKYQIGQIALHHTVRQGLVLHHIFSVATASLYFRLNFNTESLLWTVEEIADGNAN